MNPPGDEVDQTIGDNNDIGAFIGVSHGDIYFNETPDPTPQELLASGKRYLKSDVIDKARNRIEDAIEQGLVGGEVCLYLVLSLLSGRSLDQLSEVERQRLRTADRTLLRPGEPGAADLAARLALDMADPDSDGPDDAENLLDRLDRTDEPWRKAILHHLEFVVQGRIKDGLWRRSVEQARVDQMDGKRLDRAWKFFHPEPDPPRPAPIRQARTDTTAVAGLIATSLAGLAFLNQLATNVLSHLVLVVGLAAVVTCILLVSDRSARRRVMLRASVVDAAPGPAPAHFLRPLRMYCRRDAEKRFLDPRIWLEAQEPIIQAVARELGDTYPERNQWNTGPIRWLIRHRAHQISGVSPSARLHPLSPAGLFSPAVAGSGLVAAAAGLVLIGESLSAQPISTVLLVPVIAVSGYLAVRFGLGVLSSQRETYYLNKRSEAEYECAVEYFGYWQDRLRDRPTEAEMAGWLSADRVLLIDRSLKHYRLEPRRVLSHAILESPARRQEAHSRARVENGPWRHQHYDLTMFLLSAQGIRQVTTRLAFAQGALSNDARENFRYDTICSFRVETTQGNGRILKLRRMDGNADEYKIVEPDETQQTGDEVAEISAEAAGLNQTIHLLEGVAADGKAWIAAG